jgi:TalC/MipB family fructose-6-phosphate aldolase
MKLYLDSVDIAEIREAFELGFLAGLTTTPPFMHRHGITDIDAAIVQLSGIVPELQVEALGETYDEIIGAAHRLLELPLARPPVFKVPVSNVGVRACAALRREGHRVNVHLVYTLNQAYMAMAAGASFVCPLAGRLQDQGHDAVALVEQCVDLVHRYGYETEIMFSSVRHPDHIRQALMAGAHVCTVPWSVMKRLNDNVLTDLGTSQFFEHTRAMTQRVGEIISRRNPTVPRTARLMEALIAMTESRLGAATIVDDGGAVAGIITDGDVRRALQAKGRGVLDAPVGEIVERAHPPVTIGLRALLNEAVKLVRQHEIDNVIVVDGDRPVGLLDVQDLVRAGVLD